jgi:hypothetical protein
MFKYFGTESSSAQSVIRGNKMTQSVFSLKPSATTRVTGRQVSSHNHYHRNIVHTTGFMDPNVAPQARSAAYMSVPEDSLSSKGIVGYILEAS